MRFEMGSNESCACGARPLQVAGRKAGIDEPYEWKSSRTGLWGASGASPAPTRHVFGVPAPVNASFSRPDSAGSGTLSLMLEPSSPAEFTGPGTLFLNSGVLPPYAKFISYFIEEDGFALPGERAIAGPRDSFAISVEKLVDLSTWSAVLMENTTVPVKAYYRLVIQR